MTARRAVCTILAGPNGSGKSSLYELLKPDGEFVNVDLIARSASIGTVEAGRRALTRLRDLQAERMDFVFETTLSSNQALALLGAAKRSGYAIDLVFTILSSIELHQRRVEGRVLMGDHDIPRADIRRRYPKSLRNLSRAVLLADTCVVLDNSRAAPEVLLRIRAGRVEANRLSEVQAHHVAIAESIAAALSLSVSDLVSTATGN